MTANEYIGKPIARLEDERLLRGQGQFTDDYSMENQCHAVFVRSHHAHARIESIDTAAAAKMPGVNRIVHGEDLVGMDLKPINPLTRSDNYPVRNKGDAALPDVRRWPLAHRKVRFVGEPVAVVVADSIQQALDAADQVKIDYEVLQSVTTCEQAFDESAPLVWEELKSNTCVDLEYGDSAKVDSAFLAAKHLVSMDVIFPRHIVSYLEPKGVLARYDSKSCRYEIICGGQSPHWHQAGIAEMLNVPQDSVRVIMPDTGGGFGARTSPFPEYAVIACMSKLAGRPVKWIADRSECFTADTQSRDQSMTVTLAVNADHNITAVRLVSQWRLGAYLHPRSIWLHASYMYLMLCGVYRIPAAHYELKGAFTNTAPIGAFRGVARAEVSYALERIVDFAAQSIGIDRLELRKKNLIKQSELPWETPTGAQYRSADFLQNFKMLHQALDYSKYESRCRKSKSMGNLRGIGYSMFIDSVGGTPNEFAEINVTGQYVEAKVGTKSTGTGHETVFAQLVASQFQLPLDRVRIIDGDTDLVSKGSGSHASRSLQIGGSALFCSGQKTLARAKCVAAELLETALSDIQYESGFFKVPGTDRRIGLFEIAEHLSVKGEPLVESEEYFVSGRMFSSGCQACEVEIELETGHVRVDKFVAVSDPGVVFNPNIVTGQVHGGIAHGVGHALLENVHYDVDSGQLLTGSFMDYAIPRADELPFIETIWNPIETKDNPVGVKGVGETGTMGSPAAIMNAVADALKPYGELDLQMPMTAEQIWKHTRKD